MFAPLAFTKSSIGRKWIVALTGLTLVGFVVVHMLGNLQIFWPHGGGQEHLNSYAKHLHDLGPLLWLARIILLVCFFAHIYYTILLSRENRAARPRLQRYAHPARIVASVPVLTMLISGLILLGFILFHLAHFTLKIVKPVYQTFYDGQGRPDVYSMVVTGFQDYLIAGFYIFSMGLLCLHLSHGFSSVFQTLGIRNKVLAPILDKGSYVLGALLFLGNSAIPVAIMLHYIH
jgi:succinate dehydrogenase / fumarate reductase cytochrome b subunit